jgi:hypothetical protein
VTAIALIRIIPRNGPMSYQPPDKSKNCGTKIGPNSTPRLLPVITIPKALAPVLIGPSIRLGALNKHAGVIPAPIPNKVNPINPIVGLFINGSINQTMT